MEEKRFYVYDWYIKDTNHIFHVGKGTGNRCHELSGRNNLFKYTVKHFDCDVKIYKDNLTEEQAWELERDRINELKLTGQCETNFHEGGRGGNTFKYVSDDAMLEIKQKIGKTSKEHWQDKAFRDKTVNSIKSSMASKEIRRKVSERTKAKMQSDDVYNKMWAAGRANPIMIIFRDNTCKLFKTLTLAEKYLKESFGFGTRNNCKALLNGPYKIKRHEPNKYNLDSLIGAYAIRLDKSIYESVKTMVDECRPVDEILSLIKAHDYF